MRRNVNFALTGAPGRSPGQPAPGFRTGLLVRADLAFVYRVRLGQMEHGAAIGCGGLVDGPPALAREFPNWLQWSPKVPIIRAHTAASPGRPRRHLA